MNWTAEQKARMTPAVKRAVLSGMTPSDAAREAERRRLEDPTLLVNILAPPSRYWAFRLDELPPSEDNLYMPIGRRFVLKPEAREWQARVRRVLREGPQFRGPVELRLTFSMPTIASDVFNRVKALADVLKGIAWFDDCQVTFTTQRKVLGAPGVEGRVTQLSADDVGVELFEKLMAAKKAGGRGR